MLEGNPIIVFKMLVFTGILVVFIRLFARKMPPPEGKITRTQLPENGIVDGYKVHATIGVGGSAAVYRATSPSGDTVALKIPHREAMQGRDFIKNFDAEAEVGLNLQHPSIVKVMGTGRFQSPDGMTVPYFIMEAMDGRDLSLKMIDEGPLDPKEAAQISRVVADTLGWAHHRGIMHRDVSPRNIFITESRQVKVMDFGISTVFKKGDRRGKGGGALNFGTPQYLAPERTSRSDNDPRSDLYSLGCVLYEMVTGVPPFNGESPRAILMLHRKAPVIPPSKKGVEVPPQLEEIIMKLLQKDPDKRYQDAGQVTAALADLIPAC